MDAHDLRQQIRSAAGRGDTDALLGLLADIWPRDALQIIGDGLADALASGSQAAERSAHRCSSELRERGWEGDDVLANAIDAKLGEGADSLLRPVPVRLEDVATALEGSEFTSGGRIDLGTGEFWPALDPDFGDLDEEDDEDQESEREWLWVDGQGSQSGYRDI